MTGEERRAERASAAPAVALASWSHSPDPDGGTRCGKPAEGRDVLPLRRRDEATCPDCRAVIGGRRQPGPAPDSDVTPNPVADALADPVGTADSLARSAWLPGAMSDTAGGQPMAGEMVSDVLTRLHLLDQDKRERSAHRIVAALAKAPDPDGVASSLLAAFLSAPPETPGPANCRCFPARTAPAFRFWSLPTFGAARSWPVAGARPSTCACSSGRCCGPRTSPAQAVDGWR